MKKINLLICLLFGTQLFAQFTPDIIITSPSGIRTDPALPNKVNFSGTGTVAYTNSPGGFAANYYLAGTDTGKNADFVAFAHSGPGGVATTIGDELSKEVKTSQFGTITQAVTAAATSGASLIIDSNVIISADTVISTPKSVEIVSGGKFTISSGASISISVPFNAPVYQVFYGTGLGQYKLTIDVVPGGAGWSAGDTIRGVDGGDPLKVYGGSVKIVSKIDSKNYIIDTYTECFRMDNIMTNGTSTANAGQLYPVLTSSVIINNSPVVYPEWFGAKADGVTDSRLGIKLAFDSIAKGVFNSSNGQVTTAGGRLIQLSPGVYSILSTINTDQTSFVLNGQGMRSSIIKAVGAIEAFNIRGSAARNHWQRGKITNLEVSGDYVALGTYGTGAKTSTIGLNLSVANEFFTLENVHITAFKTGIFFKESIGSRILGCVIDFNDIGIDGGAVIYINNSVIENNDLGGIYNGQAVRIRDAILQFNGLREADWGTDYGYGIHGTVKSADNVYFEDNGRGHIYFTSRLASGGEIVNCLMANAPTTVGVSKVPDYLIQIDANNYSIRNNNFGVPYKGGAVVKILSGSSNDIIIEGNTYSPTEALIDFSAISSGNRISYEETAARTMYGGDFIYKYAQVSKDGVIQTFTSTDATPTVSKGNIFKTNNASPTSITFLDDGILGQEVTIYVGDANTTFVNSATFKLAGGANLIADADDMLTMVKISSTVWVEKSRSIN